MNIVILSVRFLFKIGRLKRNMNLFVNLRIIQNFHVSVYLIQYFPSFSTKFYII
jgi:hypothetical protein